MVSTKRPLTGLRVIDASNVLAAPTISLHPADLEAGVILLERPGGGDEDRAPSWPPRGRSRPGWPCPSPAMRGYRAEALAQGRARIAAKPGKPS
jgi:crotonobetainyl-CoA:carnitine CoA-transferase CaiB-like acyl-CoA transferase